MKRQNKLLPLLDIFIISALSFIPLYLISYTFSRINPSLTSNTSLYISLVIFIIIIYSYLAFYFSGILGLIKDMIQNKFDLKKYFYYSKHFFVRTLTIIFLLFVSFKILQQGTQFTAFYIGKFLSLSLSQARIFFYILYFCLMALVFIFLTYPSFIVAFKDFTAKKSIKEGIKITKKEYLFTLTILVTYFFISSLTSKFLYNYSDLIDYIILLPAFSIVFMYKVYSYYNDLRAS